MSYKNNSIPKHVIGNSNILPQTYANQSEFDLSEDLKTTIGFDKLYPVYWEELNAGDKFDVSTKTLARLMPMVAPTMANIKLKLFSFFVPNRLLWQNWTKFMGERLYQDDTSEYTLPKVAISSLNTHSLLLSDYMGIPPMKEGMKDTHVTALPFRAYNKIYNEWFRANELQSPIKECSDDNSDIAGLNEQAGSYYQLRFKGKPLDYFTSCLPYPQAGEPVMIPLTGDATVRTKEESTHFNGVKNGVSIEVVPYVDENGNLKSDMTNPGIHGRDTNLYADMSAVTGVSVEMLRKASALQVLLEKDARAGETYIDLMKAHYAVTVPDFLVGRSQYLGSSTSYVNVEPIANTAGTTDISPQGNLAGVGISADVSKLCEISAVEHGIFMIIACVDGEVSYSQGLARKFNKHSRYDYMFPEFHNLGDQAVLNKEIYLSGDDDLDNGVFGYQERYRELREGVNKVSGLMRHDITGATPSQSLDVWHLGQKFNNLPTLSEEFIKCNTPIGRVMAVPSEDSLLLNIYFDIKATRTLPVTSNPSILAGRV